MKRNILKLSGLAALILALGISASAQTKTTDPKAAKQSTKSTKSKSSTASGSNISSDSDDDDNDMEQIIIRRKGDKDVKVTVEVKNGVVKVNGKPVSEFKDDNITITKSKVMVYDGRGLARVPRAAGSPFRSGAWSIDNDRIMEIHGLEDRAFLGVVTEKDNDGAKIKEITKGSAAEKAGLKEGDIITKIDETKIDDPEDLSRAIGNHKPEEKATLTFLRDKKEQKLSIQLGKRSSNIAYAPYGNYKMPKEDFKFDFDNNGQFYYNERGGRPRLGIKAQDTEDGKGVKVIDVQDESVAEKAGIQEGDIITDFNEKPINSADELVEQARGAKDLNNIKVKLLREGKPQNIEIKIPKKLKTANL